MEKDDVVYVRHMLDLAEKAASLVTGVDRSGYDRNETLRLALAHLVQTIGEAARRVSPAYQQQQAEIPWRNIIGIRHKVVHDYLGRGLRHRLGCGGDGPAESDRRAPEAHPARRRYFSPISLWTCGMTRTSASVSSAAN